MSDTNSRYHRNWHRIMFYVLGVLLFILGVGNLIISLVYRSFNSGLIALVSLGGVVYVWFRIRRQKRNAART